MKNKREKEALAIVFGIVRRDNLVHGIPGDVPNILRAVSCPNCTLKLKDGLPVDFVAYMTTAQKAQYRQLIGYEAPKPKGKKKA